jgi:hypothetical protein
MPQDRSTVYADRLVTSEGCCASGLRLQTAPNLLAYCLITKVTTSLYVGKIDHTPERRALGDAALNEALRLRPDRSEAHLAVGLRTLARVVDRAQQNLWANGDSLALCFSHAVDSVHKDFL